MKVQKITILLLLIIIILVVALAYVIGTKRGSDNETNNSKDPISEQTNIDNSQKPKPQPKDETKNQIPANDTESPKNSQQQEGQTNNENEPPPPPPKGPDFECYVDNDCAVGSYCKINNGDTGGTCQKINQNEDNLKENGENCTSNSQCASGFCKKSTQNDNVNVCKSDYVGQCQQKPEICISTEDPVCGCDGKTYKNACFAAAKGVSIKNKGACGYKVKVLN